MGTAKAKLLRLGGLGDDRPPRKPGPLEQRTGWSEGVCAGEAKEDCERLEASFVGLHLPG